jgi:glycosyltransferase involved in cell wall biosynthesis
VPICTVVIPCFERGDQLAESLSSLVGQTFVDWEAVVVDDGSSSFGLDQVVERLGDERIRYVRHLANRGPAAARNTGIRSGTSPLIFPLDSDDRLEPTCLERLTGVLLKDPAADCVYPDFALFGAETGIWAYDVRDVPALLQSQWLPGPGCLYRRTLWERVGGYCEDAALRPGNEDWEFYLAAAEVGLVARHVPEPLYGYRVSPVSTSTRLRDDNAATREFIYARHRDLFDRHRLGGQFRSEGYLVSAWESLARGERRRAIRLAARSWRLDPIRVRTWTVLARSLVPEAVLRIGRRIRARGRPR